MVIILPTERHGLNAAIDKITESDLKNILSKPDKEKIFVMMPKFSLSEKGSVVGSLKKVIKKGDTKLYR